ncbi:sodium-coupled neutral amino acid transporter 9 homolog isoform X1 [Bombus pyrosoma]|uniref:sodium-coupled neutral amino acid transporter 9 homolog isoform X1 n=1 Tax=Bombus pyrosoma TaxID=396416 RepID=UPI001CB8B766|nr:sodium-coupled neutral amino acid transporter 9 homolog isoform X1 [Bombus pyrosoma]XP_043601507.1 sodium-coupled neutral amino acid transporter 9 homolog isoform X1 [Bombus pyrosoma]
MYRCKNDWKSCIIQHDSGSESAPLFSSGSHTSIEPSIFQDSETTDLDCTPTNSYFKYGSLESCSHHSNITVVPKRPPPLAENHTLVTPLVLNTSSSLNVRQGRCYEIHNTDLEAEEATCKDIKSKQSSLVTIFSIWNTILGSSLLTIPWGIQMAGFFPGIILILVMSGLCLYTAYCLLLVHKYYGGQKGIEVIQLCRIYLNKWAEYVAKAFSITVLIGATIAYWVLMSNFLYNSVDFIYDSLVGISQYYTNDNISYTSEVLCPKRIIYNNTNLIIHDYTYNTLRPIWDLYKTVPIFLGLLIFPFLNFNSPTFFTKFNSLGTMSIIYLITFVLIKSYSWGINMNEIEWNTSWTLKFSFPALSGMLALSFFIHNIIITVMQNNHDQSKNGRDLSIAYLLVTLTYIVVGVVFYVCFPLNKSCIEDNLLNNFQKWNGLTVGARIVLLFQLLTVYPLLAYMLRVQLLTSTCKTFNTGCVILVNIILVSICILFAVFVPYIGTIIRYTGALSGFIYVFTLPSLLYLAILKQQKKLTIFSTLLHTSIPIFGFLNLLAQFFIAEY